MKPACRSWPGAFFGERYVLEIQLPEAKPAGEKDVTARKPLDMAELKQQALEVFGAPWSPRGRRNLSEEYDVHDEAGAKAAGQDGGDAGRDGRTVSAASGGGMAEATVNGRQELLSLRLDPEVVSADDVEMLQDLILAAVNEALNRSREMMAQEMSKLTGGMQIPGMF